MSVSVKEGSCPTVTLLFPLIIIPESMMSKDRESKYVLGMLDDITTVRGTSRRHDWLYGST